MAAQLTHGTSTRELNGKASCVVERVNALRITALVASVFCLAILVSPAVASGPSLSPITAPASEGPYLTAMGIAVVPSSADPLALAQTLYVTVQATADAANVQSAGDELLARLDAIKASLVKVGDPADGIRTMGFSVTPFFGPSKSVTAPMELQPAQQLTSLSLMASLTAEIPSIRMLVAAMNAATANGASSVSGNSGKGSASNGVTQPSAADLAKATAAALANARMNAEALAAASGRKLGAMRSISSQLPVNGCCPPNSGWMLQLTVTFEYAG